MNAQALDNTPWYRQPWPWLLMIPPVGTIIAAAFTINLAIVSSDAPVLDDYSKVGLGTYSFTEKDDRAERLNLLGALDIHNADGVLNLTFSFNPQPEKLTLELAHPTQAIKDRTITLHHQTNNRYVAPLELPVEGRWYLNLSDPLNDEWRLRGVTSNDSSSVELAPKVAGRD